MPGRLSRAIAIAVSAFSIGVCAVPAAADDGTGDVFQKTLVPNANDTIKSVMTKATPTPQPQVLGPNSSVAQVPPVQQRRTGPKMELPGDRLIYMVDFSM